jgi:hypothetical protein
MESTNLSIFNNFQYNIDRGAAILGRRYKLRLDMCRGGPELIAGVIGALIASGVTHEDSIQRAIEELAGGHLYCLVHDILRDFEGGMPGIHLWLRQADGNYVLNS